MSSRSWDGAIESIEYSVVCDTEGCGRSFGTTGGLHCHQRSCRPGKRRLNGIVEAGRELYLNRKRQKQDFRRKASDLAPTRQPLTSQPHPLSKPFEAEAESDSLISEKDPGQVCSGTPPASPINTPSHSEHHEGLDAPIAVRRARRKIRLPSRFLDVLPQSVPHMLAPSDRLEPIDVEVPPSQSRYSEALQHNQVQVPHLKHFRTPSNLFGLSKKFCATEFPASSPEDNLLLEDLTDSTEQEGWSPPLITPDSAATTETSYHPFPNHSSFALGNWYWNGGLQKSQRDFKDLLAIVGHPEFKPEDVRTTKWAEINNILASDCCPEGQDAEWLDEGWKSSPITIDTPFHRRTKNPGPWTYTVGELHHRSLVSVIKERLGSLDAQSQFHFEPYELLWQPGDNLEEVRVYGEMYTSDKLLGMHRNLLLSPSGPDLNMPRAIVPLMFWSDATHLTSFGQAKVWPLYLFFGNDSKYLRSKPSMNLCTHVAYFQQLQDSFIDFVTSRNGGKGPSSAFLAHCRRETFHAQWEILLDEEFVDAWKNGIIFQCYDGVVRRFYPRIVTYSADYPEKALIASIRQNGGHPCPRCLIPKDQIPAMGGKRDLKNRITSERHDDHIHRRTIGTARSIIYEKNFAVNSQAVETILAQKSLVPSRNAFSSRLADLDFDYFEILVVDLMHEFELGVWKSLFTHLIRLLNAIDNSLVHELDRRYRLIPAFGRGAIRKFSANSSEMKKMAARDYENLLQCAIPVFDGLFPAPHNQIILNLLFSCARWHALAKLRLHTDLTLKELEASTIILGSKFKDFLTKTCASYITYELPKETERRQRGISKKVSKAATKGKQPTGSQPKSSMPSQRRGRKVFNVATYKYHALADYARTIKLYGTCDSYSTESGELEHRTPKSRYKRTDRKGYLRQMARIERRQARIRRIGARNGSLRMSIPDKDATVDREMHHFIGKTANFPQDVGQLVLENQDDPAVKDFIPKLKQHLLPRIKTVLAAQSSIDDSTAGDWENVLLKQNRIFRHRLMRVNFTTYDVRRSDDIISPGGERCNVMMLNPEVSKPPTSEPVGTQIHPFWYARVLGIFHADVMYIGEGNRDYYPHRIEFLWVRWYELVKSGSWAPPRLDQLRFLDAKEEDSFGFLDPSLILRGCHVVPSLNAEKVYPDVDSATSPLARNVGDWKLYFVNRFADRDMAMRYYWGLGIGHTYAYEKQNSAVLDATTREGVDEPVSIDISDTEDLRPEPTVVAEEAELNSVSNRDDAEDLISESASIESDSDLPDSEEVSDFQSETDEEFESEEELESWD